MKGLGLISNVLFINEKIILSNGGEDE